MSGEIVRSNPPPPLMIAGVLAIAAMAIGAKFASWSVRPKPPGSRAIVMMSSASVSSSAKPKL